MLVKFLSTGILAKQRVDVGIRILSELAEAVLALIPAICELMRLCHRVVYEGK